MIHKKMIFVHIPRTGGTSIEKALNVKVGNYGKHMTAQET